MIEEKLEKEIIEYLKGQKEYIYTDYRDFEDVEKLLEKYNTIDDFVDMIVDSYYDYAGDIQDDYVNNIIKEFNLDDDNRDEVHELVNEYLEIEYPTEEFLNQEIKVNIMCNFYNESNSDFIDNGWLRWLLQSQGYKLKDYPALKALAECRCLVPAGNGFYKDPNDTDELKEELKKDKYKNKFINSIVDELINLYHEYMRSFTLLGKMTIKEYFSFKEGNLKTIYFKKDIMCGLFNAWSGCGSILEIQLEKDIKINVKNIFHIQVENIKNDYPSYTVDDVYGLVGSCWTNCYPVIKA